MTSDSEISEFLRSSLGPDGNFQNPRFTFSDFTLMLFAILNPSRVTFASICERARL